MSEWISAFENLPEKSGEIIINAKRNGVTCGFWSDSTRHYKRPQASTRRGGVEFTEWMPLPEPPKTKAP